MLDQLLSKLPTLKNERLIASWNHGEDAALWEMDANRLGILTVDFITPVVDDPKMFGEIAAANSLSDVFAMGGRPLIALNIVGFPTECEPISVLEEILIGGAEKVMQAGAILAGGHSVQDEEPKYGLVVFGEVLKERVWQITGALEGDVLILTKPIGTGIVTTAIKAGLFPDASAQKAIASMAQLNTLPLFLPDELWGSIHACTDVTGFGLAGHSLDMLGNSSLSLELSLLDVPLLDSILEMTDLGLVPVGNFANREHSEKRVVLQTEKTQLATDVIYDPQTSGGLLLATPEKDAASILSCLEENGFPKSKIIGRFVQGENKLIVV